MITADEYNEQIMKTQITKLYSGVSLFSADQQLNEIRDNYV